MEFYCLDAELDPTASSPLHPCRTILENGAFYLSKDSRFDITSRLATRVSRLSAPTAPTVFFPLARKDDRTLVTPLATSFLCDPALMFNYLDISPLLELRQRLTLDDRDTFMKLLFAIPVIQGFYQQREVDVGRNKGVLTIISRLSPNRSGTRFLRRGIDRKGNCANFAEASGSDEAEAASH